MSTTIEMPKLSDTMSVGTVVKWHKKVGDKVVNGDTLAEIETDKATMELENFDDGTILRILVEEGAEAPIGSPLAIVGEEGESTEEVEETDTTSHEDQTIEKNVPPVPTDITPEGQEEVKNPPPAPPENQEDTEEPKKITTDTKGADEPRILVSPLAKKIAKEQNLNLANIKGSGPGGRIVKKDILTREDETKIDKSNDQQSVSTWQSSGATTTDGLLVSKSVKVSGMRSIIAKRLSESKSTIPHFYLQKEINASPLKLARAAINENSESRSNQSGIDGFNKISINDLILKACSETIKWHPEINTSWTEDEILFHPNVNLSFGVAVEGGLLTPVIRHSELLSLEEISLQAKSLIAKARNKKLLPEAMSDSTFTVTNLGMYGIDFFSGIINPPNAAILSVGSSSPKAVIGKNGDIIQGETMILGLSCDHRLVDGAIAASFLQSLAKNLEEPICMLM